MKKEKRIGKLYSTDWLASGVFRGLIRDFRVILGESFARNAENAFAEGVAVFRNLKTSNQLNLPPYIFKRKVQVEQLLKKYRFKDDKFSDAELEQRTLEDYRAFEGYLCVKGSRSELTHRVLQRARVIAKSILGDFVEEDIYCHLKFGKKSSIGCPLNLAYIDHKLGDVQAFTSSSKVFQWFRTNIIQRDSVAARIYACLTAKSGGQSLPLDIESLVLKSVPKSWKILRNITPLTLIALFYSHGVGGLISEKLAAVGLDISHLQSRHRRLVKGFSVTESHATGDLSSASRSLTSELCNAVLPRSWYCGLKKIITHQLQYIEGDEERQMYTQSVFPMGNGVTFPLETLIFYCVTKAICELADIRGLVSVYGDDLIYPSRAHKYLCCIFPKLGFKFNLDKTYVHSAFRESCGSDYLAGVDVRPFFFPGESRYLSRSKYIVELYKIYNGLCTRWDPNEIRGTLYFLLTEMVRTGYEIMRVPPSYPSTAGIQVVSPRTNPIGAAYLPLAPISCVFANGSQWIRFRYMAELSKDRYVQYMEPYYWLSLMGDTDVPVKWKFVERAAVGYSTSQFTRWVKIHRVRTYMKRNGSQAVKKTTQLVPCVAEKQHTTVKDQTGSVSFWA